MDYIDINKLEIAIYEAINTPAYERTSDQKDLIDLVINVYEDIKPVY